MKKTLYSLMLNDEVVKEIDILAHKMGTNRSGLINQILAEYVNYTTPEQRINDIFSVIDSIMSPSRELIPFFSPNNQTMSVKSSLEYKYRPTVKYDVQMYSSVNENIGELSVIFRTQSEALINSMTNFFRLWKKIEDAHLYSYTGIKADYALYDGKFVRSIALPKQNCTTQELATAISDYIQLFDKLMKGYIYGKLDSVQVETAYYNNMINSKVHI